jgi:hypothetical protein
MVVLLYCMRRVDCRACGVRVEAVPWGIGKHQLTKAYMLFLAHWARKLSWQETAVSFRTTWDNPSKNFGLVVLRLERRRLVWINVTAHPTAEWIARQITEAFPWDEAPPLPHPRL